MPLISPGGREIEGGGAERVGGRGGGGGGGRVGRGWGGGWVGEKA